jgi:hypothetical protein
MDEAALEVYVLPPELEELAAPHPGECKTEGTLVNK